MNMIIKVITLSLPFYCTLLLGVRLRLLSNDSNTTEVVLNGMWGEGLVIVGGHISVVRALAAQVNDLGSVIHQ